MPKIHLRQPGFTYIVIQDIFRIDLGYIYQNKLDKTCFQHKLAYGGLKDLTRRTASDKKWWFINFFDKRTSDSGIKNENISNKELAD